MCPGEIRHQADRLLIGGDCRPAVADLAQGIAKVVMRLCKVVFQLYGSPETRSSFLEAAKAVVAYAQIIPAFCVTWGELDHLSEMHSRYSKIPSFIL